MAPSASAEEIRTAYRQLARALHPDRHVQSAGPVAATAVRRMQEVNAAWAVLGNPSSRELYDADLALVSRRGAASADHGGVSTMTAPARVMAEPRYIVVEPPSPWAPFLRGMPWVVVLLVLGLIFVFTAFAARDASKDGANLPTAPSTTAVPKAAAGSCVDFAGSNGIIVVSCGGPHDAQVRNMAPLGRPCPQGTVETYLPGDGETACLDLAR